MIAVTRSFPHSPLLSSLSLFVFFFIIIISQPQVITPFEEFRVYVG